MIHSHQGCQYGRVARYLAVGFCAIALLAPPFLHGQTFSVLYGFNCGSDGCSPHSGLIADSNGNLYGTAWMGGKLSACLRMGCGVVYKIDQAGHFSVVYRFNGHPNDAEGPQSALTQISPDTFVGTTVVGGSADSGAIFKVSTSGAESVLRSFHGPDGFNPTGLTRGPNGALYGATEAGGTVDPCRDCGLVYRVDLDGTFTVLHNFAGGSDGIDANGAVSIDGAGNLYGTTVGGGLGPCSGGCGVVYKIDPAGNETTFHTFIESDGASPSGALALDTAGNVYGTTASGGQFGRGELYKLDSDGNLSVLYSFTGGNDGSGPQAGVVRDEAGNLYGATLSGGDNRICVSGCGVVFRLDSLGNYRVLHHFNFTDGAAPQGVLRFRGAIYGATAGGGNGGVVFKITP